MIYKDQKQGTEGLQEDPDFCFIVNSQSTLPRVFVLATLVDIGDNTISSKHSKVMPGSVS